MTRDRVRLRRAVERPAVHRGRHRRLGARRQGPGRGHRRAGRDRRADRRRGAVRGRRHGRRRPTSTRPRCGCCAAATSRSSWSPTRSTTTRIEIEAVVAVVARPRRAVPGLGAARPRLRRPARRRSSTRCPSRRRRSIEDAPRGPRRVALVGRPNVGKSSLLNRLAEEERAVVDSVAGTTVDPVDSLVEIDGEIWQLVDTAGLRKRVSQASGTEYYASPAHRRRDRGRRGRGRAARRRRADQRAGPAGPDDGRRGRPGAGASPSTSGTSSTRTAATTWTRRSTASCKRIPWAMRVNISAKTGRAVDKLAPALRKALAVLGAAGPDRRSSTSG